MGSNYDLKVLKYETLQWWEFILSENNEMPSEQF